MAVEVEELILQPFRELVQKGKEAAANAAAVEEKDDDLSKQMAKAAKAVAKEGERALKKLQPLWDSQVEKYGDSFKKSMSQNGMFTLCNRGYHRNLQGVAAEALY
jgi:hypothetical protein